MHHISTIMIIAIMTHDESFELLYESAVAYFIIVAYPLLLLVRRAECQHWVDCALKEAIISPWQRRSRQQEVSKLPPAEILHHKVY